MSLRSSMAALIAVSILGSGWLTHAAVPTKGMNSSSMNTTSIETDHWYRVKRMVTLKPQVQLGTAPIEGAPTDKLTLPPGTEVNVLDMSADGQYVMIGIDEDISQFNPALAGGDPIAVWVLKSELMLAEPQYVDMAAIDMFEEMGIDIDNTLEEQAWWDEAGLIGQVKKKKKSSMTYCLRDVRTTAVKYTAAKNIPQGISRAAIAYPAYKGKGWRPIKLSASGNPNGTACFYGGGRMDCCTKSNSKGKCIARGACGHAAIKIGSNKWKGAGIRPVPGLPNRKGKVYVFHGCLTPP